MGGSPRGLSLRLLITQHSSRSVPYELLSGQERLLNLLKMFSCTFTLSSTVHVQNFSVIPYSIILFSRFYRVPNMFCLSIQNFYAKCNTMVGACQGFIKEFHLGGGGGGGGKK